MKFHPLLALTFLAIVPACSGQTEEPPYGTTKEFMAYEVQPTAQIYWSAVGSISKLIDGEPVYTDFAPETEQEWRAVAASAVRLREFSDVLASPAYSNGRGDDWIEFARGLKDVTVLAEQAAIERDPDAVFEVGGTIYNVCNACHQLYLPEESSKDAARPSPAMSIEDYTVRQDR